jgi:hypothetical protein
MPEELKSVEVRGKLVDALRLDLVGPSETLGDAKEALPQSPSRWYLTGFLVPLDASPEDKTDETATDDLDEAGETGGEMTTTHLRNRRLVHGISHLLLGLACSCPRRQRF